MQRFVGTIYDKDGKALEGALITVKKAGTSTNATLYADNGITTKANGFTNDSNGSYEFYVQNGRYDIIPTKAGLTFDNNDLADLVLYDPLDDPLAVYCHNEFLSPHIISGSLLSDGNRWLVVTGTAASVAGDSTYRNGWIDVLAAGTTQGCISIADIASNLAACWRPASVDPVVLEIRCEKIGDAVAGTRRIGLTDASFQSGDPGNGVYFRQIDTSNVFLICAA